jgi:predicted transcriptional regulator
VIIRNNLRWKQCAGIMRMMLKNGIRRKESLNRVMMIHGFVVMARIPGLLP